MASLQERQAAARAAQQVVPPPVRASEAPGYESGIPLETEDTRPTGRMPREPGGMTPPIEEDSGRSFAPGISLDERMKRLGVDPELARNAISPLYRTKPYEKGKPFWEGMEFRTPQVATDMMRGATLPGHAMQGGSYSEEDVTKMAWDATPLGRSPASTVRKPTPGEFIKGAPSTDDLSRSAGKMYDRMKASGIHAGGPELTRTIEKMQSGALREGVDLGKDSLTPGAKRIVEMLDEVSGTTPNLRWLENTRRHMGAAVDTAFRKDNKNDARITMDMMDKLDNYVDELSGLPAKARALWHKKAKSEVIDRMLERATNSASGFENGLKLEANRLLKNDRRVRGFTKAEKKAIKRIADGGPMVSLARMIRHAGLPVGQENRYLGLLLATLGGHELGGTLGALGTVAAGTAAGRIAKIGRAHV